MSFGQSRDTSSVPQCPSALLGFLVGVGAILKRTWPCACTFGWRLGFSCLRNPGGCMMELVGVDRLSQQVHGREVPVFQLPERSALGINCFGLFIVGVDYEGHL